MTLRIAAALGLALLAGRAPAADLAKGTPDLKSAGPLAFGPDGLLLIGDTKGAAIFAVDTADRVAKPEAGTLAVEAIDTKIAALLGTTPKLIQINDMAVNPASGRAYLSVSRGTGPEARPVIVRVGRGDKLEVVAMENVPFAKAELPNVPDATAVDRRGQSTRSESITDIAYVDGRVFVAGLSNEEFSSRLLAIPYPFQAKAQSTGIEIYHGAHGQVETKSPVRTFAAYSVEGKPYLMAAYTCTPLVRLAVADLKAGAKVKGATIAELGNRNKPLDMVVYKKGGKDYILLANSSRGVMKIDAAGIDSAESISARVAETAGQPFETIKDLKGVQQLDRLDETHALILVQGARGLSLETIELP